jgi:hypothetical protein
MNNWYQGILFTCVREVGGRGGVEEASQCLEGSDAFLKLEL